MIHLQKGISSEKQLGLSEQPGDTCPMIDNVIEQIDYAEKSLYMANATEDVGELKQITSDAAWALSGLIDELEKIRSHVEKIRGWGQEWKCFAKAEMKQIENAEDVFGTDGIPQPNAGAENDR